MKRIVFLDYVRVFACFLVMLVHASKNFYGAAGATDMVGPQAFLSNETDRLWVSIYDGFYLFIPMISPWLNKATAREERFFIILFFVLSMYAIYYTSLW